MDYILALEEHYPELVGGEALAKVDDELHIGIVAAWTRDRETVGVDAPNRFQQMGQRSWDQDRKAWAVSGGIHSDLRYAGAFGSYKGLINLKPAIDLVLYSNLIWELQPRTILEFGSLQGGSALWFSDQLDSLCGHGEVHSFELCYKCIHPRASHPRLHFHEADLRDLGTLDKSLFERLPHPWLVIDDAHVNLLKLLPFVASFMVAGDYYVIEDVFLRPTAEVAAKASAGCEALGFLVDAKYADAFGYNATCSPNGWWVKK